MLCMKKGLSQDYAGARMNIKYQTFITVHCTIMPFDSLNIVKSLVLDCRLYDMV